MGTEELVRDELMSLLRYANATAVAGALGVSTQAVLNWAKGKNTSPARLQQVRALYGLPDTTKDAPSAGAEGALDAMKADLIAEIRLNRDAIVAALAARIGEATGEALTQLLDEQARVDAGPAE